MASETRIGEKLESLIATAAKILEERGDNRLAELLYQSKAEIGSVAYDNWNGGTDYITVNLYLPITLYSKFNEATRKTCESSLCSVMSEIIRGIENEHIRDLKILPLAAELSSVENLAIRKLRKGAIVKTAFDEYEIIGMVGQGGNGCVFCAKDTAGNECAIKFLDKGASASKYKRFKNEIHFCETIHHKNIVSIFDRGQVSVGGHEYAFYVMPRYDKTLRAKIKEGLTPKEAIEVFIGILEGLQEAHKHKAIHRDIKPENILFAKDSNVPVICDFGIAHIAPEDLVTTVVTKPNDRMANAVYKAPEQNPGEGGAVFQSDVYAVSLILNEMFTGKVPAGEGYETIGNKFPEYAYLDAIVSALYRQNATDRLYPIDRIITELKVQASIALNHEVERKLQTVEDSVFSERVKTPKLVGKEFKNGTIMFKFDIAVPDEWLQILQRGSFNHAYLGVYAPNTVARLDRSTLGMTVAANESTHNILQVVEHFTNWVYSVEAQYIERVVVRTRQLKRQEEDARKQKILQLRRENEIQAALLRI